MQTPNTTIQIDDTDPRILYHGNWRTGGRYGIEHNGTTHGFDGEGSSALLAFYGTQIQIFATLDALKINNPEPSFKVYIDNNLIPHNNLSLLPTIQFNQSIFSHKDFDHDKNHTLTITSLVNTGNRIWIDYINITIEENVSSQELNSTDSLSSSSSSPTASSSSSESGDDGRDNGTLHISTGGIVGVVLGVLSLLLFFAIGFWVWRERNRRMRRRLKY
ncbi:hypothetical protein VKT23_017834 [Stygiomarasmius scandens]|uniref:Uncharacterized protein n=1 Tax=Marasmiellus scandens TaxID=2682957 RepID=A0ABR1ITZ2_9AGAR